MYIELYIRCIVPRERVRLSLFSLSLSLFIVFISSRARSAATELVFKFIYFAMKFLTMSTGPATVSNKCDIVLRLDCAGAPGLATRWLCKHLGRGESLSVSQPTFYYDY